MSGMEHGTFLTGGRLRLHLVTRAQTLQAEVYMWRGTLRTSDFGRAAHIPVAESADLRPEDSFISLLLALKQVYGLWKLFVVILFS